MTAANEAEATPFLSPAEMRELMMKLQAPSQDFDRAVATAAALERVTNWILAEERDDGVKPIQALMTVGEALSDPVASARLEDGSQVVAFAPAGLEVRAFGVEDAIRVVDLDERVLPKVKS